MSINKYSRYYRVTIMTQELPALIEALRTAKRHPDYKLNALELERCLDTWQELLDILEDQIINEMEKLTHA